jgi:hypothetical protein
LPFANDEKGFITFAILVNAIKLFSLRHQCRRPIS